MIFILSFFFGHWALSVFTQSLYLHRYHAHKMYRLSPFMNRVFHLAAFVTQGSSYLNPRAYGILHRQHHQFSDTEGDPHSPWVYKNPAKMMWHTLLEYMKQKKAVRAGALPSEPGDWPMLEKIGSNKIVNVTWGVAYTAVYYFFAPSPWFYLLLPAHYLMAPIHGFIVNWCGHKYGYRNYNEPDQSRNTLIVDIVTLGELYQNNHHQDGQNPNFARRWFEWDITYSAMVVMHWLKIIQLVSKDKRGDVNSAKPLVPAHSTM